jgi:DNA end-binding protein Ku
MARPLGRGVVSFGLVSIPVEIYSAIEDHSIHFNMLHKPCGTRVRNQRICPVCKVVLEQTGLVRGFEVTKGEYVQVTDEELNSLKAEGDSAIALEQFIPLETVDPLFFESSYYLAPDKGAAKPYQLLAETMKKTGRAALAQMIFHDKESLVLLRPFKRGLLLHFLYFKNEIRDFSQIGKGEGEKVSSDEIDLAKNLMEQMTSAEFKPSTTKTNTASARMR